MKYRIGTTAKCAALLSGAALAAILVTPAQAQSGTSYKVRNGDMLFRIAQKAKPKGVTRDQMVVAIVAANPDAFKGGNINLLRTGTVLAIPAGDEVAKTAAADAGKKVNQMLASIRPTLSLPGESTAAGRPSIVRLTPVEAEARFEEARAKERATDYKGALAAYREAAENGHGLAQRRLGEIYDGGAPFVSRDYQVALYWYKKARAQGVEIEAPLKRGTPVIMR